MRSFKKGFTLIEILIVGGIILILLGISTIWIGGSGRSLKVKNNADMITSFLKTAQINARQQFNNTRWGVYINNAVLPARYSAFMVNEAALADPEWSGIPGTTTEQLTLPSSVVLTNPPEGSVMKVIFSKGTGLPSYATSVSLKYSGDDATAKTISVEENGRISE